MLELLQPDHACKGISATLIHSSQLLSPRGVCQIVMLPTLNSELGSATAPLALNLAVSSATTASLNAGTNWCDLFLHLSRDRTRNASTGTSNPWRKRAVDFPHVTNAAPRAKAAYDM